MLCKQIEHPIFIQEIKINSESIIELKVWLIIDSKKLDPFPRLV